MTTVLTKLQIIKHENKPAFAVIPWKEYKYLINNLPDPNEVDVYFPNEVVKANIRGDTLIKAWREYLDITQEELAKKAGIKQPSLARIEKSNSNHRTSTLKKLATSMGLSIEQLRN